MQENTAILGILQRCGKNIHNWRTCALSSKDTRKNKCDVCVDDLYLAIICTLLPATLETARFLFRSNRSIAMIQTAIQFLGYTVMIPDPPLLFFYFNARNTVITSYSRLSIQTVSKGRAKAKMPHKRAEANLPHAWNAAKAVKPHLILLTSFRQSILLRYDERRQL